MKPCELTRALVPASMAAACSALFATAASGQAPLPRSEVAARLRPVGAPSAVDRYSSIENNPAGRTRAFSGVQQAQFDFPNDAAGPGTPAPTLDTSLPRSATPMPQASAAPQNFAPQTSAPRTLAPQTLAPQTSPARPMASGDFSPMSPPQLGNNFATANNSALVTPRSPYQGAMAVSQTQLCGSEMYVPANCEPVYAAPVYAAPVAPVVSGPVYAAPPVSAVPAGPLLSLSHQQKVVEVGEGLIGQPKAYVQGQPVRNWLRYFTP